MEEKEKKIKDSIRPISLKIQKEITKQMEKCACKIHINGNNGTGFFAKIPYKNEELNVMITNNHILNANDIDVNKVISFSINNKTKFIKIDKERLKYTNVTYDTTIIEIKEEEDNLKDIIEYLEIDDTFKNIIKSNNQILTDENMNNLYKNESIYILNYLGGNDIALSYGLLSKIEQNKINHKCSTDGGSSGSPILNLNNNRLIGVHYGKSDSFNYNLGTLIIYPLLEFQNIKAEIKPKYQLNNKMTIKYKIPQDKNYNKIRLFGEKFVKNNKNNCEIIIKDKSQEIVECLDINDNIKKKGILEVQLKETNEITNMSHMFCRGINELDTMLLLSIPDINKWNTINIIDMSYLFCCCENLISLPDISSWNTSNVKDMSNMISYCPNLESLPDLSKWDTKNVTNMSHMFCNNRKLEKFPDISKWNTSSVKDMEHMFSYCEVLCELPNISEWDISNVTNMSYMFSHCVKLESLPDISKWNTKNVENIIGMFNYCRNLIFMPNIDESNTQRVINYRYLFYYCNSLHDKVEYEKENIIKRMSKKLKTGRKSLDVWDIFDKN